MTLPQQDEIYSKVRPEPGGTIARFKVRCLLSGILERSRWRKVVVHLPHQIRDKDENDENHDFVDDGRDGFFQDVLLGEFRKHGALEADLAGASIMLGAGEAAMKPYSHLLRRT